MELNNELDELSIRNKNDDRLNDFNLMGNPDELYRLEIVEQPLQIHAPENVTEIDDTFEEEEIDNEGMDHNNDDNDDAINDRYKITGESGEEVNDDPTGV